MIAGGCEGLNRLIVTVEWFDPSGIEGEIKGVVK
jgi:hypothetical protein